MENTGYKLFLDDLRSPKEVYGYTNVPLYLANDWVIVRTYDEFVQAIEKMGVPYLVSYDHDLGTEHYRHQSDIPYDQFVDKTGFHCAKWLIDYCIDNKMKIPTNVFIHSMNLTGAQNIKSLFDTYKKIYGSE